MLQTKATDTDIVLYNKLSKSSKILSPCKQREYYGISTPSYGVFFTNNLSRQVRTTQRIILFGVETGKQRLSVHYAVDITDK